MRNFFIFITAVLLAVSSANAKGRVEIMDGWFYVDGEKFFVKGMCYFEVHTVDGKIRQNPPEMIDHDFKLIKEAGFNTVKSFLTPERIEIARKYGLMIVNPAPMSCFNEDYSGAARLKELGAQVDEYVGYSNKYDNVLYYTMDNEPSIYPLYYGNQEKAMEKAWHVWNKQIKKLHRGAFTSVQMMPPTAFADVSMTDVVSLNLYPWNPAGNSIGYAAYLDWYRRAHAARKPLVVSEYGWTENVNEFGPRMMALLDEQIKAGVQGSYLFIWQEFNIDKVGDNAWWGVIPADGKPDEYLNTPRPIYYDYRRYFEAVVIEPKKDGIYANKLPIEIYGTDKTASMTASVNGTIIPLKKKGRYWWVGEYTFGPDAYGRQTFTIEAKDGAGSQLTKKDTRIFLNAGKQTFTVKIKRNKKYLKAGDSYEAKLTVSDEKGKKVSGITLKLGVTQSAEDAWGSKAYSGVTDARGEYLFKVENIAEGYFHLMAGLEPSLTGVETRADVDIIRIEMEKSDSNNQLLNRMSNVGLWKTSSDSGSTISLSKQLYFGGFYGLEISYNLGTGKWAAITEIIRRDLSKCKGIRFMLKDNGINDRVEIKLIDSDGSNFVAYLKLKASEAGWVQVELPFSDFKYGWGGDDQLDLANMNISFALSRAGDKNKGPGALTIGKLEALK